MIGILGGTFDPVHFGHLRPALDIQQALGLEEICIIPCNQPPHRPQPLASRGQRLTMLEAAIDGHPVFRIDTREYERAGPSYMLDTLKSLREDLGAVGMCLLLGMDSFISLPGWHRWHELIEYCHIVVMTRPGTALPGQGELADFTDQYRVQDAARLETGMSGMLLFHPVTLMDISATRIRKLLAAGQDAGFLLPGAVLDIIAREDLYRNRELL
jgi:nicotinate-nucleotide adenylyltransferase